MICDFSCFIFSQLFSFTVSLDRSKALAKYDFSDSDESGDEVEKYWDKLTRNNENYNYQEGSRQKKRKVETGYFE